MAIKNEKFDSFLKRTLDEKDYVEVKACDPCIVTSQKDKHAFRFVFVTNNAVCLTDNPPKSVVYKVLFRDVKEINAVHDTAAFLQKDLQEATHHLVVRYTPPTPPNPPAQPLLSLFSLRKSNNHNNNNSRSWPLFSEVRARGGSPTQSATTSGSLDREVVVTGNDLDLHLYILNESSSILAVLRAAWTQCLLDLTAGKAVTEPSKLSYDITRALFCDLKADIVQSFRDGESLEDLYRFLFELRRGAEGDFRVRELFWRDPEMLRCVADVLAGLQGGATTCDHIECMELCCQILSILFQTTSANTHSYSSPFLSGFVSSLLFVPGCEDNFFSVAAAGVLYSLICFTEQVGWGRIRSNLTSDLLFRTIDRHPHSCTFLDVVVADCVQVWNGGNSLPSSNSLTSPSSNSSLTGDDAVKLYRNLVVVHRCILKSERIRRHASASYEEEFRYYIRVENLASKIPSHFPAVDLIKGIIKRTSLIVLQQ